MPAFFIWVRVPFWGLVLQGTKSLGASPLILRCTHVSTSPSWKPHKLCSCLQLDLEGFTFVSSALQAHWELSSWPQCGALIFVPGIPQPLSKKILSSRGTPLTNLLLWPKGQGVEIPSLTQRGLINPWRYQSLTMEETPRARHLTAAKVLFLSKARWQLGNKNAYPLSNWSGQGGFGSPSSKASCPICSFQRQKMRCVRFLTS